MFWPCSAAGQSPAGDLLVGAEKTEKRVFGLKTGIVGLLRGKVSVTRDKVGLLCGKVSLLCAGLNGFKVAIGADNKEFYRRVIFLKGVVKWQDSQKQKQIL
jgi:hypothetical protein